MRQTAPGQGAGPPSELPASSAVLPEPPVALPKATRRSWVPRWGLELRSPGGQWDSPKPPGGGGLQKGWAEGDTAVPTRAPSSRAFFNQKAMVYILKVKGEDLPKLVSSAGAPAARGSCLPSPPAAPRPATHTVSARSAPVPARAVAHSQMRRTKKEAPDSCEDDPALRGAQSAQHPWSPHPGLGEDRAPRPHGGEGPERGPLSGPQCSHLQRGGADKSCLRRPPRPDS